MTSTPASVHHLAPPTLVGPQPDAIAAPADDSAFAELLAAVSPEHTERLGALHRYNDVRRLLEVPIDVGGSRSLLRGVGISGEAFEGPALVEDDPGTWQQLRLQRTAVSGLRQTLSYQMDRQRQQKDRHLDR